MSRRFEPGSELIVGLADGQGKSLREIAELLNGRGVKPKRAKRWLHSSVLRILSRLAMR